MRLAKTFLLTLSLYLCACSSGASEQVSHLPAAPGSGAAFAMDTHLVVDQFGYRPSDRKVAVIRNPQAGFDRLDHFTPGEIYEVRSVSGGAAIFAGRLQAWRNGRTEESSGDSGWWFDFSALTTPGRYYVVDVKRKVRSAVFTVAQDVYRPVLKAAVRTYFYQRSGFKKQQPFAAACWVDDAAYAGRAQDTQARDITDRDNRDKIRDLSGGWFDAGDTNKYVTFATIAVNQLLTAYQDAPGAFTDDFNIPESGNGVPDVLDEIKWETDWLKRMQYQDGSSALKVGEIVDATGSRPSADRNVRFYVPSCTSATIAAAGMFAHAAIVYGTVDALRPEGADLGRRAAAAWENYQRTAQQLHCDTGVVRAGIADWNATEQESAAVVAAVYLYALTGKADYSQFIKAHFRATRPYRDSGWSRYSPEQGEALLYYTSLAHADPGLKTTILTDKAHDAASGNQVYGFNPDDDLYRAFMHDAQYHWGSSGVRANYGNSNIDALKYRTAGTPEADFTGRAEEILHYFHGVNPFAMVYLSNMYGYGASRSANEIYHTWFWHDSKWSNAVRSECGPAPGFVPGGPNADAVKNGVPANLTPPAGQPRQKSYRDWNTGWPESSWAVTEPGIYYQSAYVELVSKFVQ